jgi:hypothetical protein
VDREVSHEVDFRGPDELPFNRPSGMPALIRPDEEPS